MLNLVFLLLVSSSSIFANAINVYCEQNSEILSYHFAHNWQYNSSGPYNYISIVNRFMGDLEFTGTLHSKINQMPMDKNPGLQFNAITLQNIEHYGLWQIACRYQIKNPFIEGLLDRELFMISTLSVVNYTCKRITSSQVTCQKKPNGWLGTNP